MSIAVALASALITAGCGGSSSNSTQQSTSERARTIGLNTFESLNYLAQIGSMNAFLSGGPENLFAFGMIPTITRNGTVATGVADWGSGMRLTTGQINAGSITSTLDLSSNTGSVTYANYSRTVTANGVFITEIINGETTFSLVSTAPNGSSVDTTVLVHNDVTVTAYGQSMRLVGAYTVRDVYGQRPFSVLSNISETLTGSFGSIGISGSPITITYQYYPNNGDVTCQFTPDASGAPSSSVVNFGNTGEGVINVAVDNGQPVSIDIPPSSQTVGQLRLRIGQ